MQRVKIGPEAAEELQEAAGWYEEKQTVLGTRFLDAFDHAIQLLREPSPPLTPVSGASG